MAEIRIGVDTGGTFTDFFISINGKFEIKKIPSTPSNPSLSIIEGIKEFVRSSVPLLVIHGTTVATNSLLERKGGKIALITTKGFEDIIFIGRQVRLNLYSLKAEPRVPLLSSKHCFGIKERTSSAGKIEINISTVELNKILNKIEKIHTEAVAVSLINSFANPANEKIILKELKKKKIMVSVSSKILPEYREYERTTVTVVNAYLMPVISQYLTDLTKKMPEAELRIMQSNEGHISPATAKKEPIRTALSGPAGGVVAAFHIIKAAGFQKIITLDMGGTSSDVSLIDGKIRRTNESTIGNFPVRLPMINIHTVGAGGGSIAYVDSGGSLRVGPQSAGAVPGPACYGQGIYPTVTDANLILGRLSPEFFLGGRMKIFPDKSLNILKILSKKINKSIIETAAGIIEIANANMEKAIRVISIEQGFDPRNFALFSFGGAGGMHAVEIAANLKMPKVIIPKNAGVLSAIGLLLADSIKDYSKSVLKLTEEIKWEKLEGYFAKLCQKSLNDMQKEGFKPEQVKIFRFLDLRYFGQSYEITIPVTGKNFHGLSFVSEFHNTHQKLYSYHHHDRPVEIVNIRVKAVGINKKIRLKKFSIENQDPKNAFFKKQTLFYKGKKLTASVFKRSMLKTGNMINGPALVVDHESTTFLPPAYTLKTDSFLNLIIQKTKHL